MCLLALVTIVTAAPAPHRWATRTVVLANADDPASVGLARTYQEARGIPETNLIFLPVSEQSVIDRRAFIETIWNPLRLSLLERGLIQGEVTGETDVLGRELLELYGGSVRYLMICRGVPVKVAEAGDLDDSSLLPAAGETQAEGETPEVGSARFPEPLRKNRASVDTELAMLMFDHAPLTGPISNPLFGKLPAPENSPVVKVTRLDGPTPEAARRIIASGLRAETIGLRGRAYFDLAARSGSYRVGDEWIRRAAGLAREADFDVTIDEESAEMPLDARFDTPAIYFGWYASRTTGVFRLPDLSFPPGAIAAHLHSSSASHLRDANRGWVGPLIAGGVTATVGNVYEPYLEQTHHFDLLLEGLLMGMNFADAAYAALPSLSWQTVAVGDPLYEPAWTGLEEQVHQLGDPVNAATDPYVVIRKMNRLLREGEERQAWATGLRALYNTPGAALALKVAEIEAADKDLEKARRRLGFAALIEGFEPQEWAVYHAIARRLDEWGGEQDAAQLYASLLADERLPKSLRLTLLKEGADVARRAGRTRESVTWQQDWHALAGAAGGE